MPLTERDGVVIRVGGKAVIQTIGQGTVTYDLARQIQGAREVRCSEFGAAIRENIQREAG